MFNNPGIRASDPLWRRDDSSSDLSELGETPSPPGSPPRYSISDDVKSVPLVECTHLTWCTCPRHASYTTDQRFPHLSEHALSRMQYPELAERPSLRISGEAGEDENIRSWETYVLERLPTIAVAVDREHLRSTARNLVEQVNHIFGAADTGTRPPSGEIRPVTAIEQIGRAIRQWHTDANYSRIKQKVAEIVHGREDVMRLFEEFLPRNMRNTGAVDVGVPTRTDTPVVYSGTRLEEDRLALGMDMGTAAK